MCYAGITELRTIAAQGIAELRDYGSTECGYIVADSPKYGATNLRMRSPEQENLAIEE